MKILISILVIGIAIYVATKENGNPLKKLNSVRNEKTSAKEFLKTIESLGYFKYANKKDIQSLKKNHLESFDPKVLGVEFGTKKQIYLLTTDTIFAMVKPFLNKVVSKKC